ncbi:hypothetical protein MLD38_013632 [Melastoma candidum]|uniref:Uncharacterized protein n=1 Tax=Melastoma candidum TaxID=119954 RepID=A0ACB9RC18_9MYRT|nr:hypothetical protein MLD38_013632 [Melastoma candidum]
MRSDTCFKCKGQGHWARDCPFNSTSPSYKSPTSASSSPLPPSKLGGTPIVQCPCGSGPCCIRTANTAKNPNRSFFACPRYCREYFNGWCDEVSAPVCPCRAGTCSINTDPASKKKFFSCRIKTGHGACRFFQWVDDYNASGKVKSVEAGNAGSPVNVPPQGVMARPNAVNEDTTFADLLEASQLDGSTDLISKFEELVDRVSPEKNQSNFNEMTEDNQTSIPSSSSEDLEMEDREPTTNLDKTLAVSGLSSRFADVHLRQTELLKELCAAAGNTVTGDGTGQNLLPDAAVKSALNTVLLPQSTGMNGEDHNLQNFLGTRNGNHNPVGEQIFEKLKLTSNQIKWELVKKLEASDQHDPAKLQQDASIYFAFLDHLSDDSQHFKDCVNKFIQHATSLAEIRTGESALNVLLERYEEKKRQFEKFSHSEAETLNAFVGCSGRIEFLRQEVLRLKEMLLNFEKELGNSEEEFAGIGKKLSDIHRKMEFAKASMEDASADAAEASIVLKNMELEQCAMKAALEEAKEQLNQ